MKVALREGNDLELNVGAKTVLLTVHRIKDGMVTAFVSGPANMEVRVVQDESDGGDAS